MKKNYKEFCWYDGDGKYHVLEINPEEATKEELITEARRFLKKNGFTENEISEQLTHCYIIEYSKSIMD
jgi:ubiquinone biosynthesis protein COQ9